MFNKKEGITLVALVVMIVVLLILTSVFIATGMDSLNETKNSQLQAEKLALQEAINVRYTSFLKNPETVILVGSLASSRWASSSECVNVILSNLPEEERTERATRITNEITRDYANYVRIITSNEARILGVEPFIAENVYIVDYNTATVYGPIQ